MSPSQPGRTESWEHPFQLTKEKEEGKGVLGVGEITRSRPPSALAPSAPSALPGSFPCSGHSAGHPRAHVHVLCPTWLSTWPPGPLICPSGSPGSLPDIGTCGPSSNVSGKVRTGRGAKDGEGRCRMQNTISPEMATDRDAQGKFYYEISARGPGGRCRGAGFCDCWKQDPTLAKGDCFFLPFTCPLLISGRG